MKICRNLACLVVSALSTLMIVGYTSSSAATLPITAPHVAAVIL